MELALSEKQIPQTVENIGVWRIERTIGTGSDAPKPGELSRPAPGTYRNSGKDFTIASTLHLPSIKVGLEMNYRFAGVFHALNQRHARLCR
jgi:hypothetical protein